MKLSTAFSICRFVGMYIRTQLTNSHSVYLLVGNKTTQTGSYAHPLTSPVAT